MPTHYEYLGVLETATPEMIEGAYGRLCRMHRSVRDPGDADATRLRQSIEYAHEVLSDPERRLEYDRELEWSRRRGAVAQGFRQAESPGAGEASDGSKGWLGWLMALVTAAAMISIALWISWWALPEDAARCGNTLSRAVENLPRLFMHHFRLNALILLLGIRLLIGVGQRDWKWMKWK